MPRVTMTDALSKADGATSGAQLLPSRMELRSMPGSEKCGTMLFGRMNNQAPIALRDLFNETVAIYRAAQRNPPFAPLRKL